MKKGRRLPADLPTGDIRHVKNSLSRPMTGHTPQKLPLSRNLLLHRSARTFPARPSIVLHAAVNVKCFFVFFHKNFQKDLYRTEKIVLGVRIQGLGGRGQGAGGRGQGAGIRDQGLGIRD